MEAALTMEAAPRRGYLGLPDLTLTASNFVNFCAAWMFHGLFVKEVIFVNKLTNFELRCARYYTRIWEQ